LLAIALHVHAGFLLQQRRKIVNNRTTVFIPPSLPTRLALIRRCSVFFASRAILDPSIGGHIVGVDMSERIRR
jgi:hypothetical protein